MIRRLRVVSVHGWTLIELLVVTAIVALLAAVAVGPARQMLDRSVAAKCVGNLKQLSAATALYAAESDGMLPMTGTAPFAAPPWYNPLVSYLGIRLKPGSVMGMDPATENANTILQCPAYKAPPEREVTYAPSISWANERVARIPVPSRKIWLITSSQSFSVNQAGQQRMNFPYPQERAHALYFDGHVESISREELKEKGSFPFNLSPR